MTTMSRTPEFAGASACLLIAFELSQLCVNVGGRFRVRPEFVRG